MKKIHGEYIKFLSLLAIVSVSIYYLMDIVTRAWNTKLMQTISDMIRLVDPTGISVIMTFIIGFYIGSLILLLFDRKKRAQSIILVIGIIILVGFMMTNFMVKWNPVYIIVGVIVGILLGSKGVDLRKVNAKSTFKSASSNISKFSVLYATIALIVVYIAPNADNSKFIFDLLIVFVFSWFFSMMINYEIKGPKIVILGPEESGKTLFLAGCYKRTVDTAEVSTNRNGNLIELMSELHVQFPGRTKDIKDYNFTYEVGKIFPRETILSTLDYPGIYLKDIAQYIDNKEKIDDIEDIAIKSRVEVSRVVASADMLIFIIDSERYPKFQEMGLDHYLKIVTKLEQIGKNIEYHLVVTKSDLFKDGYPNFEDDYEGFRKFIEEKFIENIFIKELLVGKEEKSFYPVFYYTQKLENPKYDPDMPISKDNKQYENTLIHDKYGNVYVYGFDKFMNRLTESD